MKNILLLEKFSTPGNLNLLILDNAKSYQATCPAEAFKLMDTWFDLGLKDLIEQIAFAYSKRKRA
jgi:hypothetical protein